VEIILEIFILVDIIPEYNEKYFGSNQKEY